MKGSTVYKYILIIISVLMIFSCATNYKSKLSALHTPQLGEKTAGNKIEMFDTPLKVSSTEKKQKLELFCIRQSESLPDYKMNIRSAPDDMIYVIFTIKTYWDYGRRFFIYKYTLPSAGIGKLPKKERCRLNKIAKDDIILFDTKGNSYYFSAFAFWGKKFQGYFFDYDLFHAVDYITDPLKQEINFKRRRVIHSSHFENLVFTVPKESVLDYLLLGESKLKIPSN